MVTYNIRLLACPACGASLTILTGVERLSCTYCAASLAVERRESDGISLSVIQRLQKGMDRTAAELAIVRLNKEIRDVQRRLQAETGRHDARVAQMTAEATTAWPPFMRYIALGFGVFMALALISAGQWGVGLGAFVLFWLIAKYMAWLEDRSSADVGKIQAVRYEQGHARDRILNELRELDRKLKEARAVVDA